MTVKKYILPLSALLLASTTAYSFQFTPSPQGVNKECDKQVMKSSPVKTVKPSPIDQLQAEMVVSADGMQKTISQNTPFGSYYDYEVGDDNINFWAFQTFGMYGWNRGVLHSTTPNTEVRDYIRQWPKLDGKMTDSGEEVITAGCMVGDKYWAYVAQSWAGSMVYVPVGIYEINLETGEKASKPLFDDYISQEDAEGRANEVLMEMSYDPVSDYVYALRKRVVGDWPFYETDMILDVVRLDPANPSAGFETLGEVDYSFTMACDDGYIYFIQTEFQDTGTVDGNGIPVFENMGCTLYRLNLEENANVTQAALESVGKINSGFLKINYLQTMEFDHGDHTLWWVGSKDDAYGTGFVTRLNTTTAKTDDEFSAMPVYVQYTAMAIPYELKENGTPHYVRDLAYTVGENGEGRVDFTWTNPSKNSEKETLTSLTDIKIYKDGSLYKTVAATGIGQTQSWSDTGVASGTHSYKFVATNGKGEGLSRQRNIFIGRDVPGAVTNINVTTAGAKATITWTPSAAGANNGWYDKTTQKYTVTRMPDNKIVADKISETTVTDEVTEFKGYTYKIVASNAEGEGLEATSLNTPFGPDVEIPYINKLQTQEEADVMTVIDNNTDGMKWTYGYSSERDQVYIYISGMNKPDEWLITPSFAFDAKKKYEIRVIYSTTTPAQKTDKIEIRQGAKNDVASQTVLLNTLTNTYADYGIYKEGQAYITDPSKGNYLSLHIDSESGSGSVMVKSIVVREYSATDVSVSGIDGAAIAYTEGENPYSVSVKNEGSAAVRGAKAQLINYATGEVLGESTVPAMKPGEEKTVEVMWQPAQKGNLEVSARAVLDGDTYIFDNEFDKVISVEVVAGKPSTWFSPIKKDNSGYIPFYVSNGYSHVETIYFASEINKTDVNFTGITYPYDPAEVRDDLTEIPVRIYLGETTNDSMWDYSYYGSPLPDSQFILVYEGLADMSGNKERNEMTMLFNKPFSYKGDKNLVVKAIADISDATSTNPYWHILYEEAQPVETRRSVYSADESTYRVSSHIAAIKLAYRDASGVEGVLAIGLDYKVFGNSIIFSQTLDTVEIFDLAGRKIAKAQNTNSINGLGKGCYILRAKKGTNNHTSKFIIK